MKLFVFAALVAVAASARLEHLENSYLPPFGSNRGFGSPSSRGSFGANSGAGGSFAGAISNQYLPPDHGPSANNGVPEFAGSLQGFGGQQNFPSQQYASPSSQFGAPSYQQFGQQPAAASRQYLAPRAGSSQQYPQQAFDEETGYHY